MAGFRPWLYSGLFALAWCISSLFGVVLAVLLGYLGLLLGLVVEVVPGSLQAPPAITVGTPIVWSCAAIIGATVFSRAVAHRLPLTLLAIGLGTGCALAVLSLTSPPPLLGASSVLGLGMSPSVAAIVIVPGVVASVVLAGLRWTGRVSARVSA